MEDAYTPSGNAGQESVQVTVLLLQVTESGTRARVRAESGEVYWVPAELVADGLGVPVDEHLPLQRATALVSDGRLVGFAPPRP